MSSLNSIYFPTRESAENLFHQIQKVDVSQQAKTYDLNLASGIYEVSATELSRLKEILEGIDVADGSKDGRLPDYRSSLAKSDQPQRWGNPVLTLDFESFIPSDLRKYEATKIKVEELFTLGKIAWKKSSNEFPSPLKDYDEQDVQTLTELAISNNYSAEVLQEIQSRLPGHYSFFIQRSQLSAGIAMVQTSGGDDQYFVGFSLGASQLYGLNDAPDEVAAVRAIRGWIHHEYGHRYMNVLGYQKLRGGFSTFVANVGRSEGGFDLYAKLQGQLRSPALKRAFEYFTQEVGDGILIRQLSLLHYCSLVRDTELAVDEWLRDPLPRFTRPYQVMTYALIVQRAREAQIDKTKVDRLDEKYRAVAIQNDLGEFYDDMLRWYVLAQQAAGDPILKAVILEQDPHYFESF